MIITRMFLLLWLHIMKSTEIPDYGPMHGSIGCKPEAFKSITMFLLKIKRYRIFFAKQLHVLLFIIFNMSLVLPASHSFYYSGCFLKGQRHSTIHNILLSGHSGDTPENSENKHGRYQMPMFWSYPVCRFREVSM